jgi:hypothetical protein
MVLGQSYEGGPFLSSQARTDLAGAYTLSGLDPSRLWTIQFQGEDQGFVSEFYDDEDGFSDARRLAVNGDAPTTGINAALQLGSTISGTVALSSNPNSPVESAQIRLSREAGGFTHTSFHSTDSLGAFSITGLPLGTYILEASADGMLTSWWQDAATRADADAIVISSPGQVVSDVDFLLDQGGTISGTVQDIAGNPIVGVQVSAEPTVWSGSAPSARTDANGEYVLTNVASIDYRLSFTPPDGSELRLQYWPSSDTREGAQLVRGIAGGAVTDLSVVLPQGGTVRGRVTSAQTSSPIAGIQVSVQSRQGLGGKFATTDSNGVWEVRGLIPADDYVVSFNTGQGHVGELFDNTRSWSNSTLVVVTEGGVRSGVDAALDLSAQVSGRVIDSGGNGIEGIWVSLWLEGSPSGFSGMDHFATTDSTGMWVIPDVASGNYRVLFGRPWETVPNYRAEWHRDTYNPNASTRVVVTPGGAVTGINATLAPNIQPAPPRAPTISVSGASSGSPTVSVILPSSGPTAYGFSGGAGSMREGGDIGVKIGSGTADLDFFRGRDAQVLVEAYAFGADGQSASVRELVVFGGGPGIRSTPVVQVDQATRNSLSFSWAISQAHSSVDRWILQAFPVGGSIDEGIFWSSEDSGATPDVRAGSALIGGLQLGTTYEVFVAGSSDDGQDTFRSRGLFTTSGGTISPAPTPTVMGVTKVGSTLSASTGSWGPAPVSLAHQWLRAGAAISGATASTYVLVPSDLAATISVRVTGTKPGYAAVSKTSASTVAIAAGTLISPTPTISGTRKVGSQLTAVPGSWGPAPVTLRYQWFRTGTAISGANLSTYTPSSTDIGRTLTVRVTGSKPGYSTVSKTSVGAVALGTLTAPTPRITGTLKVPNTLNATDGTWGPGTVALTYRWHRNGAAISGATGMTYKLSGLDAGAVLTVKVTGSRAGFATVTKTSAATTRIVPGTLTPTPTPTVSGSAKVGSRLTANAGSWGPGTVTLSYQWNRNGSAISGATASTYVLVSSDAGRTITVRVTGRKTGYTSASKLSSSTATVTVPIRISGDGIRLVPSEVPRTTYVTTSKTLSFCSWETKSAFTNSFDDIVDIDIGSGQRIMEINSLAVGVETNGCGSWVRLADIPTARKSSVPGDGLWSVQKQIVPGLYRASAGTEGCYWGFSSDFTQDFGSLIDNYFDYLPNPIVQIYSDDVAFESDGCGSWTRISD